MNIQVHECTVSLELKRKGDSFIIDTFRHHGYSDDQLKLLNMVRIYTKVTTLSDMVSGDGRYLLAFVEGKVNPISHYLSVNWPSQGYPPPKAWRLWKKEMLSPYLRSSIRSTIGSMDKERCEMGSGVGST